MEFIHRLHLHQAFITILSLSTWLILLSCLFVPLEHWYAIKKSGRRRATIPVDLAYFYMNSLLPAAILSVPVAALAWLVREFLPETMLTWVIALPVWAQAITAFVVGEIGYYWGHRWSHEIPFLWRFHSIHHAAEEVDYLVNMHAHPLDMVFSRFCGIVPIFVLGLGGPTIAAGGSGRPVMVMLIGTTWGFFIHANVKWRFGPLEWLVSSPMFHHWHHTKTGPIDHNYSSTLPWLDRLFGTHYLPSVWPESYGIEAAVPTSLLGQIAYPLYAEDAPLEEEGEEEQQGKLEA